MKNKAIGTAQLFLGILLFIIGVLLACDSFIFLGFSILAIACIPTYKGILMLISKDSSNPLLKKTYNTKAKIIAKIKRLTIEFEGRLPLGVFSCYNVLQREIKNRIKLSNPISEKDVYALTMNLCYELLASGEFHLYAGELNPIGEAYAIWRVCKGCAMWLISHGFMTEEQYNNFCDNLDEDIATIG